MVLTSGNVFNVSKMASNKRLITVTSSAKVVGADDGFGGGNGNGEGDGDDDSGGISDGNVARWCCSR